MTFKALDNALVIAGAGMFLYDLAKRVRASTSSGTAYINAGFNARDVFGGYDVFKSQQDKKKTR